MNDEQKPKNNNNDKEGALKSMLHRVEERLSSVTESTLEEAFEHAIETAHQLEEVTLKEAKELAKFIKRDLADATKSLKETGSVLSNWFQFDVGLLETRLFRAFEVLVDKSRLELNALHMQINHDSVFQEGELILFGLLACEKCGNSIRFTKPSVIERCSKCNHQRFVRV